MRRIRHAPVIVGIEMPGAGRVHIHISGFHQFLISPLGAQARRVFKCPHVPWALDLKHVAHGLTEERHDWGDQLAQG